MVEEPRAVDLIINKPRAMTSLEETRSLNIARNNDFLKSLFGNIVSSPKIVQQSNLKQETITPSVSREHYLKAIKAAEQVKKSLLVSFPHRKNEIEGLCGYVDEVCMFLIPSSLTLQV